MKRILIVNNNMHIGGVQKALLNLLQTLHAITTSRCFCFIAAARCSTKCLRMSACVLQMVRFAILA